MATLVLLLAFGADPGGDVLNVFVAKCALCHVGKNAKGNFSYVLDLSRLAQDKEKVIPGNAKDSNLWKLVIAGNMPPNDAKSGSLSGQQKAIIKAWIDAGAPLANLPKEAERPVEAIKAPKERDEPAVEAGGSNEPTEAGDGEPLPSFGQRLVSWLGKGHLLLLHFPIALLASALFAEGLGFVRAAWAMPQAVRFCLVAAALTAIPVTLLGWTHGLQHGSGDNLTWHRLLGTIAAGTLAFTALSSEADYRMAGKSTWLTRILMAASMVVVGIAAHYGAMMVHGSNFLEF